MRQGPPGRCRGVPRSRSLSCPQALLQRASAVSDGPTFVEATRRRKKEIKIQWKSSMRVRCEVRSEASLRSLHTALHTGRLLVFFTLAFTPQAFALHFTLYARAEAITSA